MGRFAIGCLFGALLLVAVIGGGAYVIYRGARPVVERVTGVTDGVRRMADASEIERGLTNTAGFHPPSSGELTDAQVDRFLRVQEAVVAALGQRADAFGAKYRELTAPGPDGRATVPTLPQVLSALTELSTIYLDARRAQVEAMNRDGFSRDEFSWVRVRVYQAAGLDVLRYDARELQRLLASMAAGARLDPPDVQLPDAPERNKALVAPHATRIARWLGMAAFGL